MLDVRSRRTAALLLVACFTAGALVASSHGDSPDDALPAGLELFLKARLLESDGQFREALTIYDEAVAAAPDAVEIRVAYASLLNDVGLAEKAVEILDGLSGLDWYGKRTRAQALARLATRRPEMLPEAEAALREILAERPDDAHSQLALAQVVHRQGNLVEAEKLVADLRRLRGGSGQLAAYHGALLRGLGRTQEAADAYADCIDSPAQGAMCRGSLVELLIELGRPGEAGEVMLENLGEDELDQRMRAARMLYEGGRSSEALRAVRSVLVIDPDSAPARALEAQLLADLGQFTEASTRLRDMLRHDPDNIDLALGFAWTQARAGDLDKARELLSSVWRRLSEEPTGEDSLRCVTTAARIELSNGNPLIAREWLDRITDVSSAGVDYVRLAGITFRQSEQWADGVASMLRLQPRLTGSARTLAVATEAEMRLRLGDARGLERLRPLLASDDLGQVGAALQVLQALERWEDVEREARAVLERTAGSRDLRFARSAALERLGRFEEAESAFLAILEDHPEDAAVANYIGYMWADAGVRLQEALELIRQAVQLEPANGAYLDSLGWVHFRLGNLAEAEGWLRRSIELGSMDGTVLGHLGEVLLTRGQKEKARPLLESALDRGCDAPDHIRALLASFVDAD